MSYLLWQATAGVCTAPKPGMLDFVAKAKWEAWSQLSDMEKVEKTRTFRINVVS